MLLYFNGLTDTGLQTQGNRILFFFCHYKQLITPWRGKQREWLASAQPLKLDAFPDFVESEYTVHNSTTADGLKPIRTVRVSARKCSIRIHFMDKYGDTQKSPIFLGTVRCAPAIQPL